MMRLAILTVLLGLVLASGARAEVNPDEPVEFVPFQPATLVDPEVTIRTAYSAESGTFTYLYGVRSGLTSRQPLGTFSVGTSVGTLEKSAPFSWSCGDFIGEGPEFGAEIVLCSPVDEEDMLAPGESIEITLRNRGVAGVGLSYVRGDVVPPQGNQVMLPPPPGFSAQFEDNSVKVKTVVPMPQPEPFEPVAFADFLHQQLLEAAGLGWVTSRDPVESLLLQARSQLAGGDSGGARSSLQALLGALDDGRGTQLDDNAYYLLKADVDFFLDRLTPREALAIRATVASKHVQPHIGRRVEVQVESSAAPMTYDFSIFRVAQRPLPGQLGDLVFQQVVQSPTGTHTFTWDGLKGDGQRAHNGDYDLVIRGTDPFGRQASQTAGIQVNFVAGGKAGRLLPLAFLQMARLLSSMLPSPVGSAVSYLMMSHRSPGAPAEQRQMAGT
ncbi:MAG: hypothetical protein HY319_20360 [Armatimonadetes bacterium]|nr:hypothetical protein [Armatimonadota bacterium]